MKENPKKCSNILQISKSNFHKIINHDLNFNVKTLPNCPGNFCVPIDDKTIQWSPTFRNMENVWFNEPKESRMLIPMTFSNIKKDYIPFIFKFTKNTNLFYTLMTFCNQYSKFFVKLHNGKKTYKFERFWSLSLAETSPFITNCDGIKDNIKKCDKTKVNSLNYYDNFLLKLKCFDKPVSKLKNISG